MFDRLGRQPLVIVTLWVVAAVLAVLVGVVGIGGNVDLRIRSEN